MKKERIKEQLEVFPKIKQMLGSSYDENVFIGMNLLKQLDYKDCVSFARFIDSTCRFNNISYKGRTLLRVEVQRRNNIVYFIFLADYLTYDKGFHVFFKIKTIGLCKKWMKKRVLLLHEAIDCAINRID